ncbi:MAG: alpha-amylase family glycosyl hydrolase, partial [Dehalococcoidia bacterium]|nr:alpha-amylase family glycosyl hydrolase [Dehalococcoidia bacterium]
MPEAKKLKHYRKMEINAFSQKIFNSVLNSGAFSRRPVSTYRLQLNSKFTFRKAAIVVPYLHELGITDCYLSPYFNARPGSMHGYDISNYNELNPEIGSWAGFK